MANAGESAVLIAGPTASGKSALALRLARERNGIIVNTDALQVYDVLRQITARPPDADLAEAPHLLYGTVPPSVRFSTGDWSRAAQAIIPIENSQHGRVADIHFLLPESGLHIIGEYFMPIHHALMALGSGLNGMPPARSRICKLNVWRFISNTMSIAPSLLDASMAFNSRL